MKKSKAGMIIKDCTFTSESFVVNDNVLAAVKSLAEACSDNARALEAIANRMCGPSDNRIALKVDGGKNELQ